MAKELQHPQITEAQLELWLLSDVTQALLKCIAWRMDDIRDAAGSGKLTDSGNADLTHALLHRALGQQDGLDMAGKPEALLEFYEMVHRPENDDAES